MNRAGAYSDEEAAARSAVDAAQHSYSPYSGFRVGAAAVWRLASGEYALTSGCNVENAFYEAAHAETTALTAGACRGYRDLVAMFVACPDLSADAPIELLTPCGFCRQWMTEFIPSGGDVHVIIVSGDCGVRARFQLLKDLLPLAFRLKRR